ncbi:MAG: beta/gamma crystallin-related protein [Casimicrobium sp.]
MNYVSTKARSVLAAIALFSSVSAAHAADILIYSERDFYGSFAQLSRTEPYLPIGAARSVRVGSGIWEVCTGQNFMGECRRLSPGDYREVGGRGIDAILSVRDVTYAQSGVGYVAPKLQLYEGRQYRGRTLTLDQNVGDLGRAGFDDRASSAIVSGGTWEVCTEYNFRGRCQALPPGNYPDLGAQLDNRILSARSLAPAPAPAPVRSAPPERASSGEVIGAIAGAVIAGAIASQANSNAPAYTAQPYDRTRVEVYTDPNFLGQAITIDSDASTLRNTGVNDRIQSMRVFGGTWEMCENRDYGGVCMTFGPGDYRRLPPQLDRVISSMRQITREPVWTGLNPSGGNYTIFEANGPRTRHPVWLFEHADFGGASLRATGDIPSMGGNPFNDRASGMFISWGTWQFCEHDNYGGRCFTAGPGQYAQMPAGMNDTISSFRRIR